LQQHRADGQVATERVLLGRAAHVADRHAINIIIVLVADGGHHINLHFHGRFASGKKHLCSVHILVLGGI